MSIPILFSKLYIPASRSALIERPRLRERLNTGMKRKLTLVSAPAGFGKTTVLSAWIAATTYPATWLSLDERDNDPVRFLTYVVAALQTIEASVGQAVMEALTGSQPPPLETLLTALLNDLSALTDDFVLVLDDYHLLESPAIDEALRWLLDHLPPQMHVVIATREDPQLPLSRLRARNQLTELRAVDLRFTAAEAADFLKVMGLHLSSQDIIALEKRTEGWIAGLQLAALSLQGRTDAASFIRAFTGSHRFVVDYLLDEVLHRQPEPIRRFLLQTSILNRLNGALCDAVTASDDSQTMLETLERNNLFVVALDDERRWYRYHHLFTDALRNYLQSETSDDIRTLHRRASDWYGQHDLIPDAIHHALAGQNYDRAADLIESVWHAMDQQYQSATWVRWVRALPDDMVQARPILSLGYAWALLNRGDLDAAEARLRDAEHWLGSPDEDTTRMIVIDEAVFRSLPAAITSARAYRALTMGDTSAAMDFARQALAMPLSSDEASHRQATALLGIAHWANGDLDAADAALVDFMEAMYAADILNDAVAIPFILSEIRLTQGRLRDAFAACERSLKVVASRPPPLPIGTEDVYRSLCLLHCERDDLPAAQECLRTAEKLRENATLTNWQARLSTTRARLHVIEGDLDGALRMLDTAEQQHTPAPLPVPQPIAAKRARIWIKQGELAQAWIWARAQGINAKDDAISYLREYEYITLARLHLAEHWHMNKPEALRTALGLLARLLQAAEAGSRTGTVIEILLLQALAQDTHGDEIAALQSLTRALVLAAPEGYVRVFVDEGRPLLSLLADVAGRGIELAFTSKLQAALSANLHRRQHPQTGDSTAQPLVEPLTERELEILRLVAEGLSNREIGERLYLALDTIKGYNRRIFAKLNVQRRTEAVARARALGLL